MEMSQAVERAAQWLNDADRFERFRSMIGIRGIACPGCPLA